MVKIKAKLIIWSIILLFLISTVSAESKLSIDSIKAYTDGNKDSGTIDISPESNLELKIKIKNTYTDDEDLEIQDIGVTATINDIDDGDDLEEESDEFDLDADDSETIDIEFDIPLEVEDGTYDLVIFAEGKDENGTKHNATDEFTVRVKKESHDIKFYRKSLDNNVLKCIRSTTANIGIVNIGKEKEEDVEIEIKNSALDINVKESGIELDDDPFDDESKYRNTYTINVPSDALAGLYKLSLKATYNEDSDTTTDSLDLTVEDCPTAKKEEEKEEVETVIQPPTTTTPTSGVIIQPPTTTQPVTTKKSSLFSSDNNTLLIAGAIIVELIVIVVGIILVVMWAKRGKKRARQEL
ncbi:hypothetical protein J4209_06675 [Candidatus Woesearchaeota archaeon]|nr:hypothetical protein [Candidatus Woesearchaeota archaeon]